MKARTFLLAVMAFSITGLQAVAQNNNKRVLVAYFSATGTTAQAAAKLADITGGKLYAITPAKPYTSADLDWHGKQSRSSVEMAGLLFPVFFEDREDQALQEQARIAKITARLQMDNNVYDYLKFSFNFKSEEINRNKKTIIEGQNRIPDVMGFLADLKNGARFADNPKGYVIGAIIVKQKYIANFIRCNHLYFNYIVT